MSEFVVRAALLRRVGGTVVAAVAAVAALAVSGPKAQLLLASVAAGIVAVFVTRRYRIFPLIVLLGATLLISNVTAAKIGFPSVGLNIIDIIVLFLVPWVFADTFPAAGTPVRRRDSLDSWLLVFFLIGTAFLLVGVVQGAALRSALRDYRLFVYTPVLYAYTRSACRRTGLRGLATAWVILALGQLAFLATGRLVLEPQPGTSLSILPTSASTSVWHFLGVLTFFPMVVAIAVLGRRERLGPRRFGSAVACIALSIAILALTFNRTLWLVLPISIWTAAVLFRSRGLPRLSAVGAGMLPVLAVGFAAASLAIPSLSGELVSRFSSAFDTQYDPAVSSRITDSSVTLGRVAGDPLGHGLGVGELASNEILYNGSYAIGSAQHDGYVWLGYDAGIAGAAVFLRIIYLAFRRLRRTRAKTSRDTVVVMAVAAMFVGLVLSTALGTVLLNYLFIPYWGITLGMLAAWSENASSDTREGTFVSPPGELL